MTGMSQWLVPPNPGSRTAPVPAPDYNSSDNETDRERSSNVKNIVPRLARKRPLLDEDEDEDKDDAEEQAEEDDQAEEEGTSEETNKDQEKKGGKKKNKQEAAVYLPSSFVVAVYGEDWFVGEVRDKEGEPRAAL